ncbi:MAG: hypothetical protein V8S42_08590 [Lachnospiraceae bacterium]
MKVVENSSRYTVEAMIPVILISDSSCRMRRFIPGCSRGYEDIRAIILILQFLFLLIPGVIILVFLIIKWKRRKYTTRDLIYILMDKKDKALEKARVFKR